MSLVSPFLLFFGFFLFLCLFVFFLVYHRLTHDYSVSTWSRVSIHTMGGSHDPFPIDERSSTYVTSIYSERNLPGPGVWSGIFPIHDSS